MNRQLTIAIIVAIVLLGGVGVFLAVKKNMPNHQTISSITPTPKQQTSAFNSIAEALMKSLTLTCDFTDDQGRHTVSYVKSGMIRAEINGKTPAESESVLIKDKKIYFWNSSIAMVMDLPSVSITPTQQKTGTLSQGSISSTQNMMDTMEKFRKFCKAADVADSWFVLPANVKFTDASKMMPSGMPLPSGVPSGYAVPSAYQQYMPKSQ